MRQLARLAQDKDEGRSAWQSSERREREEEEMRQRFDATPRINLGQRGWDTPLDRGSSAHRTRCRARSAELPEPEPGPRKRRVRDDLGLDAFQRNYTSEDNAAFASILGAENAERRARNAPVWEFERVQESHRLEGEAKRKAVLDAAQSGWTVDGDGRRMLGGLASGSREKSDGEGEAWSERKLITASAPGEEGALVKRTEAGALVKAQREALGDKLLPAAHPLSRALELAGLPPTAVTDASGAIVPARDLASGAGDGRGRGALSRAEATAAERAALGSERGDGGAVPHWPYRAMNGLMFPPDAYSSPYPPPPSASSGSAPAGRKGPAPSVAYRNTRLDGEEEDVGRAPSTSYASSWVDRAVKGGRRSSLATDATSTLNDDEDEGEDEDDSNKYDLVDEPELEPDDLPLLTYGSLLATPKRISTDGDGDDRLDGPSFRFPEQKRRDELGRKLGNRAGRAISDRARMYAPSTPKTPSALRAAAQRTTRPGGGSRGSMGPPSARGNLTPAAQSLLQRTTGRTPMRFGKSEGIFKSKVGGMGWSPSPRR